MLLSSLIVGISSSVDSLGIGITYGIKKVRLSNLANLILFCISITVSTISLLFGNFIAELLPNNIIVALGSLLIIFIGIFMTMQALKGKSENKKQPNNDIIDNPPDEEKIYSFFIKCFGITVQVIKNPNYSDFDNSKKIDSKEALFLGIALSLDSFGIVIGSAVAGICSIFLPIFVSLFQILFLKLGNYIGRKISSNNFFPDNSWSIISGILLIIIGIIKLL